MDPCALLEHLDGWVLSALEEGLSKDNSWQKLASVAMLPNGESLYSVNDICQLKACTTPASDVVRRLVKHGICYENLLNLLTAAQLDQLHSLLAPPENAHIVRQPSPQLLGAVLGTRVILSIEVKGNPPPVLLWYKEDQPLLHHTTNELIIESFGPQDEGIYICLVRQKNIDHNDSEPQWKELWSKPVEVYIEETAPEWTEQPQDCTVMSGGQATFKALCGRTYPAPLYSWYKDGQLLTSPDEPILIINEVDGSSAGEYCVVASNSHGIATSRMATLRVQEIPSPNLTIARQPQIISSSVCVGQPLQLWCSVRCDMPVTFAWYKCGCSISSNEINMSHSIMSSTNEDIHSSSLLYCPTDTDQTILKFICIAKNSSCSITSEEVVVSVLGAPSFGLRASISYTAQRKWALLVGNTRYEGKPLNTTIPDCLRLAEALEPMGYKCLILADLTLTHFRNAVTFMASHVQPGDYVMFYYGGHGYHEGGDRIILIDAKVGEQGFTGGSSCLSPVWVRNVFLNSSPALLFVVLDMCRTTLPPYANTQPPLATVLPDAARCSVVLHATSIHCAALEAPSSTSVLTRHLLNRLHTHSSEPLTSLAAAVLQDVYGDAVKVRQQQYPLLEADLALPRTLADACVLPSGPVEQKWRKLFSVGGSVSSIIAEGVTVTITPQLFRGRVANIGLIVIDTSPQDGGDGCKLSVVVTAPGCRTSSVLEKNPKRLVYKLEDLQCLTVPVTVTVADGKSVEKVVSLSLPGIACIGLNNNDFRSSTEPLHQPMQKLNISF